MFLWNQVCDYIPVQGDHHEGLYIIVDLKEVDMNVNISVIKSNKSVALKKELAKKLVEKIRSHG